MMRIKNEKKVCDAIIQALEKREGASRKDVIFPEKNNHPSPVEMVCKIGDQLFAFEHTEVEPFSSYIGMQEEAKEYCDHIRSGLEGKLPDGAFELHIPANAFQDKKKKERSSLINAIVDRIEEAAPKLSDREYADYRGGSSIGCNSIPFDIFLYRFKEPLGLIVRHIAPDDMICKRNQRMEQVRNDKFEKLYNWKKDKEARTILILEDRDMFLTNQDSVAEAFLPIAKNREDRPDEVYLVATYSKTWHAWPILMGDISYYDMAKNDNARGWEIHPATLNEPE